MNPTFDKRVTRATNMKTDFGNDKLQYDSISDETRLLLVQLIEKEGMSVHHASKLLEIKYSTAKVLFKRYKVSGQIIRSKKRKAILNPDIQERRLEIVNSMTGGRKEARLLGQKIKNQGISRCLEMDFEGWTNEGEDIRALPPPLNNEGIIKVGCKLKSPV